MSDMSDPEQRRQWADHLKDEADALQQQQDAAGATNVPLAGPLPHTADDLAQGRLAERTRCAQAAEAWADPARLAAAFPGFTPAQRDAAAEVARAIGAELRASR